MASGVAPDHDREARHPADLVTHGFGQVGVRDRSTPDLIICGGNDLIDPLALVTASYLKQQFLVDKLGGAVYRTVMFPSSVRRWMVAPPAPRRVLNDGRARPRTEPSRSTRMIPSRTNAAGDPVTLLTAVDLEVAQPGLGA